VQDHVTPVPRTTTGVVEDTRGVRIARTED
jgi:hypothetical protein